MDKNNTWDILDLPKGKKSIRLKWVFKVKWKADGSTEVQKRLVGKGYNQKYE